ncbi:hypothetical protein WMY93_022500 [Mugilogobius chulae]|uniref:LRRCT domain-containing protein n=1 Tax=Mugilogobius chulae TaxID=88201 RepID=A0AAW0N8P3_9GOBI
MELLLEDNDFVHPHQLKGIILAKVKKDVLCPSHPEINLEEPSKSLSIVVTPSPEQNQGSKQGDAKDDSKNPSPSHLPGSPCVEFCACHNHPVTGFLMHCQDRGIQEVSDIGILQQSPTKLVMTGNMIQKLRKSDFVTYDSLELLNLANNRIDYIDNETFLSLSSLKKLYLNGNRIEKLFSTMFVGLHNLEFLYLEYNLIKEIAPGTFNPLPNLKLLSLNNNLLSSLPPQIFRNVPLNKLNLRKNLLMHLPIYLEDNPWDCSCDLLSLKQWVETLKKDTVVGSILCHTPKKVVQSELRSLRHEVLCPSLGTYYPNEEDVVTATLGPDNSTAGLLRSVPLSVLILSMLVFILLIIFCSAGLVVFIVHRRRRRAKRKALEEQPRENSSSSPIHLHYSMYGQKTTHHTLTQRTGPSTLYEERSHSPIVQICRNPTYCAQHKEHETDMDYSMEDPGMKHQVCRSIMEKENTSPLTGNPKYRSLPGECPAEFVTLANPNSLYRNILEREKELQQLGITEYLRKNMPQLQSAVDMQVPGHQEELKLMEAIMYTRPRKVMLEQTKNEYFELKANLHTEPDYLEVLEHQTPFN